MHKFTFRPKKEMEMNIRLQVYFKNYLESKPIIITIKGECIKVPIYIEKELYDFEIIVFNQVYM